MATLSAENEDGGLTLPYSALINGDQESEGRGKTASLNRNKSYESTELREPASDQNDLMVPLVSSTEAKPRRYSTSLKNTLKQMKRELSSERRVVADAFIDSTKNKPQYVKMDYSNDLLVRARLRMLRGVDSLPVRLLGLLMVVADVIFIIVDVSLGKEREQSNNLKWAEVVFQILDLLFSAYFCIEVSIRIIGLGKSFFQRWFEVLDLIVVMISTLVTIIYIFIALNDLHSKHVGLIRLFIVGRIIRVLFWARIVYEHKGIKRFFRNKVSQNKRRYIDEHFDLDLTYVTDRVIAMSFPSSGSESLYRNSIRDVGEFLDKNHFGHYRVYNLCSEREYDTSYFHNQVQRILIDDHNVPRFTDLVDFCEDVYTWMEANPDNVIVVHCKGGKGRTGTMISAWLVRAGLFSGAGESLAYFSVRRTDRTRGNKSQGVQTPSQSRYVLYYEKFRTKMGGELPRPISYQLKKISFHGLCSAGKGDGTDWSFEILHVNEKIFEYSFQESYTDQVEVAHDLIDDCIELMISKTHPLILTDDVKFKFYNSTSSIPTGNDKCQFYFWFNTTFIENNRVTLDRAELDNLQKSRIQRYYPNFFAIELDFEPCVSDTCNT